MKRIIDIDESLYNRVKEKIVALSDIPCLCKAVDDSTPYNPSGEWIVVYEENNIKTCKCSKCGRIEDIVDFDKYPFCHCGADMRGGAKSEKA